MTRLICCVSAIAGLARAADAPPDWQTVRSHQPAGLVLKLTLPKNQFFLGELIEGNVEITHDSPDGYAMTDSNLDHHLRYFATDEAGKPVIDPLAWASLALQYTGGLMRLYDLGTWNAKIPTVSYLRFDQLGKYVIWAWTDTPRMGNSKDIAHLGPAIGLVSERSTITIVPRTAADEAQVMAEAQRELTQSKEEIHGVLMLDALQTPASHAVLRSLISDDSARPSYYAEMGLMESPNPPAEAAALLDDVSAGKVPCGRTTQWVYSWLERYDRPEEPNGGFEKEHNAAFDRVLQAARKASGGKGPAFVETLWVEYGGLLATDPKWPAARAALAAHQLELSQAHKDEIVLNWFFDLRDKAQRASLPNFVPSWKGTDFLPLAREALTKPPLPFPPGPEGESALTRDERSKNYARQRYHSAALAILANEKPDEARPIIVADLQRDEPVYFGNGSELTSSNGNAIPVVPMPELDSAFRTELASKDPTLSRLICLIAQYGTASLEPDVLAVYTPDIYEHDSTTRDGLVRYLKRCDPAKADAIPKQ